MNFNMIKFNKVQSVFYLALKSVLQNRAIYYFSFSFKGEIGYKGNPVLNKINLFLFLIVLFSMNNWP